VFLSWRDNAGNETGFRIERRLGNGAFQLIATLASNVTAFTDLTAPPSTVCAYRIQAVNGAAASPYSAEAVVTSRSAPVTGFVDFRNTTPPFDGSPADPWPTLEQAHADAHDGTLLHIESGTYSLSIPLSKLLRLTPTNGPVLFQRP
jgi:hypothetical protein